MKLIKAVVRSLPADLSHQRRYLSFRNIRSPFAPGSGTENGNNEPHESFEEFQHRLFGGTLGNDQKDSFYKQLDKLKSRGGMRLGPSMKENSGGRDNIESTDDLDESFSTLSDGLDGRLKKAATYFEFDPEEVEKDDYSFRPDAVFQQGDTYDIKDLDLTKPGVQKQSESSWDFEVTTEEVLRKADFRNVRFLANFITDAGIIIKRSQTGISAKAQRKVAREIKIARAFGLMPFTTMGQFPFVAGKTREELESEGEDEYRNQSYVPDDGFVDAEPDTVMEPVLDP